MQATQVSAYELAGAPESVSQTPSTVRREERATTPAAKRRHRKAPHVSAGKESGTKSSPGGTAHWLRHRLAPRPRAGRRITRVVARALLSADLFDRGPWIFLTMDIISACHRPFLSPGALPLPISRSSGRRRCPIRRAPSLGTARRPPRCLPDTQTCVPVHSDRAHKCAASSPLHDPGPRQTCSCPCGTAGPGAPGPAVPHGQLHVWRGPGSWSGEEAAHLCARSEWTGTHV